MKRFGFIPPFLTTVVVLLGMAIGAFGQVALKPNGRDAAPLRLKAMTAKVTIIKQQFATTDLDLTFQNELSERIEADFLYTVPAGAVVTDFAYFYGEERVVARIAEKERAAAIYQHITTRMRDPALVEMVGKNTFRARIFPVMPDADLRVQIRFVQILPAKNGVATYTLPLRSEKSERLESVSVNVSLPDAQSGGVTNNIGLPMRVAADGVSPLLTLDGKNYRSNKDLRVSLALPTSGGARPLWASMTSARSGGANGFFALALSGKQNIYKPQVGITGVSAYDVEVATISGSVIVTGRYGGGGNAVVNLRDAASGVTYSPVKIVFRRDVQANNPASKFWAAARIARLSNRATNRAIIVALSQRFTLPSKYTSWIAIPEAERQRYYREKAEADREIIGRRLTTLIFQGHGGNAEANKLRSQFNDLCKTLNQDPAQAMRDLMQRRDFREMEAAADIVAREIVAHREGGRTARRAEARLNELSRQTEQRPRDLLSQRLYIHRQRAAKRLAAEIIVGRPTSGAAQRERALLERLCRKTGANPQEYLTGAANDEGYTRVKRIVEYVEQGKGDTPENKRAERELQNAARAGNFNPQTEVQSQLVPRLSDLARQWAEGKHGESLSWHGESLSWNDYRYYAGYEPDTLAKVRLLSPSEQAALRKRINRLADYGGQRIDNLLADAEMPWAMHAFSIARSKVVEANKTAATNPNGVKEAETTFLVQSRSDEQKAAAARWGYYYGANTPDGREAFAKDRVARIAARTEGELLDAQIAAPPDPAQVAELQSKRAELKRREDELRARMGDPLISVDAPADAKSVVALLPNGEIKPLTWNAKAARWQAHFDIPTYAAEGAYEVAVFITLPDGTRQTRTFRYHVDVTAPQGKAQVARLSDGRLRLVVDADPDTIRVAALLPWGERVTLSADTVHSGRFVARVTPPANSANGIVTFILTDRAHNRTRLSAAVEGRQ